MSSVVKRGKDRKNKQMKQFKFFRGIIFTDEYTLPIARRMAGRTIANNLIQIQPMFAPLNRLFYMDYTHND